MDVHSSFCQWPNEGMPRLIISQHRGHMNFMPAIAMADRKGMNNAFEPTKARGGGNVKNRELMLVRT